MIYSFQRFHYFIHMSRMQKKKNPAAVALAKLGASKGGTARAKKLSQRQRSHIARVAARARWSNA
jgi:hypothetical protein